LKKSRRGAWVIHDKGLRNWTEMVEPFCPIVDVRMRPYK